ncbi:hypothetical protein COV16_03405 [Candidatus Woesearchaeota archaeon CG10_big_fil_rev_8_21_14_0_10_34_8]|nr:MAG: hypothetical protein COV16_03405 [Candidatus Woesearchaeota archaeon CG10_big_fil_rev_8_21_14_0_10_34_8]
MKHSLKITALLLLIFVLAQINGFFVLDYYFDIDKSAVLGEAVADEATAEDSYLPQAEVENKSMSAIYIMIALLLGTAAILLLIKFRQRRLWKLWFLMSVFIALIFSLHTWIFRIFDSFFSAYILYAITVILCLVLAYYKVIKANIIIHNFTEIFIYGGITALIAPILNVFSVAILMILLAIYDAYAVWKSKHMVKMAEFQTKEKVFAGLCIPYKIKSEKVIKTKETKNITSKKKEAKMRTAVLGGGDVAFPLLFSSVVMLATGSYIPAIIITATTTTALAGLFYFGEKGKFYPAIPFIAVGCFIGYGISLLI